MELLPQPVRPQADQQTPFPPNASKKFLEETANEVVTAFRSYESAWRSDQEKLFACYEDFTSVSKRRVSKLFSNLLLPTIYTDVRLLEGRIGDAILATNPLIDVMAEGQIQPDEMGDVSAMEHAAGVLKQVLNDLYDSNGGRLQALVNILDGLIFGRMIAKTGWEVLYREDGNGYTVSREYPIGVRVSPFNFMLDPRARNVQESIRTFETIPTTQYDAHLRAEQGFWDPSTTKGMAFNVPSLTSAAEFQRRMMEIRKAEDVVYAHGVTDAVECIQRLDPDGNGQATMHYIWFDPRTGKLLGIRPCTVMGGDQRPLVVGYLFPATSDQPYGIGVVEVLRGMARAKSSLANQALDNAKVSANARTLVNVNAEVNEAELSNSVPGGKIHAADITPSGIGVFQAKPVTNEILALAGYLDGEMQAASSVTDIAMAMKAPSTAYATGLVSAQSQANFDIMAVFARESFFNDLFDQLRQHTQRFLDMRVPATIDAGGMPAAIWVNREALQGNFRARCSDLRIAGKRKADAQVLMSLLSIVAQTGAPVDLAESIKYILSLNDVPQNIIDKVLPPGRQVIPAQAQGGVPGQPNPTQAGPPPLDPNASRLQIRPGPGGDVPDAGAMPMMAGTMQ